MNDVKPYFLKNDWIKFVKDPSTHIQMLESLRICMRGDKLKFDENGCMLMCMTLLPGPATRGLIINELFQTGKLVARLNESPLWLSRKFLETQRLIFSTGAEWWPAPDLVRLLVESQSRPREAFNLSLMCHMVNIAKKNALSMPEYDRNLKPGKNPLILGVDLDVSVQNMLNMFLEAAAYRL